jgi:hypothetical protein
MIKNIIFKLTLILITLFFSITLNAQVWKEGKPPLKERLYFGGNFSFSSGKYMSYIEVTPQVGYLLTPRLISGVGATYIYYKNIYFGNNIKTHIYGGKVFSNYSLIKDFNKFIPIGFDGSLAGYVEYEALSLDQKLDRIGLYEGQDRFIQHNVWVGGGLNLPMGKKSFFSIYMLWNLNEDSNSLEQSPIVRVGFSF